MTGISSSICDVLVLHCPLQMAIADMWIRVLKTKNDFEWDMGNLVHTMTNR